MSGILHGLLGSYARSGDPNWASVAMLLAGDGANGAQNNTFVDSSTNAFSITRNGAATQGTFSPFTAAAPYSASTRGGSGYFNGTSSYLTAANNTAFRFSVDDFTVECYIYWTGTPSSYQIIAQCADSSSWAGGWTFSTQGANLQLWIDGGAVCNSAGGIPLNTWTHVAVTRSGSTCRIFINGQIPASGGTGSTTANILPTRALSVGADAAPGSYCQGFISNLRIVKGTALYTANFTPPAAPVSAVAGTSVLLDFANAGVIDNAMLNVMETVGNAQISTVQSRWGGSSIAFDGAGDWLTAPDATAQQLGTGNFTIEGWLRLNATGVAYGVVSKGAAATGWGVSVTSGNLLQFSYTATQLTGASSLAANTWYHFAVVRSGSGAGNLRVYLNGTVDATSAGAVTDNFNQTNTLYVGADRVGGASLNGYIDDLRITKGVARYTANFTPPSAAFPTS